MQQLFTIVYSRSLCGCDTQWQGDQVTIMFEPTPHQLPTSAQPWRHFCDAVTAANIDLQRCLSSAVDLVMRGWGAQLAVVRLTGADDAAHEHSSGSISAELRTAMTTAEQQLAAQAAPSVLQTLATSTLISLPLIAGGRRLGVLHVSLAEPAVTPDDLALLVQLLSSAVARQTQRRSGVRRASPRRLLDAQHSITHTLVTVSSAEQAISAILQTLCTELGWDSAAFWRIDPVTAQLRWGASWTSSGQQPVATAAQQTWAEHVQGSDGPCWIADLEQDTSSPGQVRSLCGARVASGSEQHGLILLLSRRRRPADPQLLKLVAAVSSQLGQFIALKQAEQGIRRQNDAAILTLTTMSEGVIITNDQGLLEFVNPALTAMVGRSADALLGRSPLELALEADRPLLEVVLDPRYGELAHTSEVRLTHTDGSLIDTLITGVPRISDSEFAGAVALVTDQTARKRTEAEAARLNDALRIERDRLLRREIEVRTQIGRDLHDGPVQQVAVAVMTVQYVRLVMQYEPERLSEALDELLAQLQRATRDLRTVLYELRPLGIAEEGLVAVLRQYVARPRSSLTPQIHLDAPTSLRRLPPDHEAAVFIIMQEAINNARKYARAEHVWLTLRDDATALYAEVRDNGRGFDVAQTQASYIQRGSFGLLNMRERAQLIGGDCTVSSQLGQGTTVQLRIPVIDGNSPAS